jgi:phosphatidylglycerophosphate synthase
VTPQRPGLMVLDAPPRLLFGLSMKERLMRQVRRAGLNSETDSEAESVIVARGDVAIDQPLVQALIATPGLLLLSDDGSVAVAIHAPRDRLHVAESILHGAAHQAPFKAQAPSDVKASFWKALRKREVPYATVVTDDNRGVAEWRMFMGTYKGATDLVTKHAWPVPAFHACRFLAPLGITPNMVTSVAAVMTVLAFWLFLRGDYAWGLVAAWAMTFLDTVDGKLARLTLTSSKWGDVFDHGIDLVHPPFWYVAWALGLAHWGVEWSAALFWWVTGAILGGYVLQRAIEGIAIKWLGLEIHIWRPIDTAFRQVTARRNPNLLLLTVFTLFGRPDLGLIAVAIWTVVCLILHGLQLLQALASRKPLVSWMSTP